MKQEKGKRKFALIDEVMFAQQNMADQRERNWSKNERSKKRLNWSKNGRSKKKIAVKRENIRQRKKEKINNSTKPK
ncbi:unnamed protein product [Meloidogyne enterolobii]|uniref:Uncharacterized protein n=1 Tax=Meloidogyne enterolobii TaxID=390850 RepID=A0ACB0ZYD8_MELEN